MAEDKTKKYPYEKEIEGHKISVYAESGRATLRYRYTGLDGKRTKAMRIPLPKHMAKIPEDGIVAPHIEQWVRQVLLAKAGESARVQRELEAAVGRQNHISWKTFESTVRKSEWYKQLSQKRKSEVERSLQWVGAILRQHFAATGDDYYLSDYDPNHQATLLRVRTTEDTHVRMANGTQKRIKRCRHNTARQQLGIVATAADRIKGVKVRGRRLLDYNPFTQDAVLPGFKERQKRERLLPERYELILERADRVDPTGRFRVALAIDRWIGIRPSTVVPLNRIDIMFTAEEIETALWALHRDARPVPDEKIPETARLYAENGGAIYLDRHNVKQARSGKLGVAQYDRIVPMGPALGWEVRRYIRDFLPAFWPEGEVPSNSPLLPMEDDLSRPIHESTVQKWWEKVENLTRADGVALRKLRNTRWSGFRQQRIYELKAAGIPSKEIYYTVGWSTNQGGGSLAEGQLNVAEGVYLKVNPSVLVRASQEGEGNKAPRHLRAVS